MVIEVLIVSSIITIALLGAMAVTQKSIYVVRQALHATQAGFLLEEGAEAVRILRDNTWTNISSLTNATNYYLAFLGGTWTLTTTASDGIVGSFTRTVTIASVNRDNTTKDIVTSGGANDAGTKLVTVTVTWVEAGTTVTKTLKFYIIDIFS